MKSFIHTSLLLAAVFVVTSCKKEEEKCVAGSGGNVSLIISLQHHNHTLISLKNYRDTVYVKYNVQEFPGTEPSLYDATFIGEYEKDSVAVTGLKCGNYYLYAVGLEPMHFMRVTGGIPVVIGKSDNGLLSKIIPVSE